MTHDSLLGHQLDDPRDLMSGRPLNQKRARLEHATRVAQSISLLDHVTAVYVFGSVARNGVGRDLDLVVEVPELLTTAFYETVRGISFDAVEYVPDVPLPFPVRYGQTRQVHDADTTEGLDVVDSLQRLHAFIELLRPPLPFLYMHCRPFGLENFLDVLLLPTGWRASPQRASETVGGALDAPLLARIAQTARLYDAASNSLLPARR